MMCRILGVAVSGYYLWLQQPISNHDHEDARLLRLIRASFVASHGIYGSVRVFLDLREAGETCSKHRVARLMRENSCARATAIESGGGAAGRPPALSPNSVRPDFTAHGPSSPGVTITTNLAR